MAKIHKCLLEYLKIHSFGIEYLNIDENGTDVDTAIASDPENATLTYTLSGTDASALTISSTGVITFNSAPDYETKTSYSVTVTVSDGSRTDTQDITVSVNDINETPVFTSSASFSADEQQLSVGTVVASDEDGDALTFSLSSGS